MDESEYIELIWDHWPSGGMQSLPSSSIMSMIEDALAAYPASVELHDMHGNLLFLSERYDESLAAYETAHGLSPHNIEVLDSLGYFHDIITQDPSRAEDCFRRAIDFGGSPDSYAGLARVLTESGRKPEALRLIAPESCPFASEPCIEKIRREIAAGEWDA